MNASKRRGYEPRWLPPRDNSANRRASLYFLADYYAWSARKGWANGNSPIDGRPWDKHYGRDGELGRRIGRVQDIASARLVYAIARAYPNPLP